MNPPEDLALSSDSESEPEDLELVGVHFPSIEEFRQAQREVVSVLGNHMGTFSFRYRELLQEWYNGGPSAGGAAAGDGASESKLPFFMDLQQRIEHNREKLSDWVRDGGPRVFLANRLPHFDFPREGFFPELSLPELSLPEMSLPEMPTFPGFKDYLEAPHEASREVEAPLELELTEEDMELSFGPDGDHGCEHYKRNCKVHCITCQRFYPCRLCHDEDSTHALPRQQTKLMLCQLCTTPQYASQYCSNCHHEMASYFCPICKLWSDDELKPIFHCGDCGICRVGQGLNIDTIHCHTCGVCMNLAEADKHKCLERSAHSNCPICLGFMFNSTEALVFMSCGHPMHKTCYDVYTEQSYRCPLCLKSIVDTSALFRVIDDEVAQEQLPPDLAAKRVDIKCCDCRGRSRVPFHVAGLKCSICKSYNTIKL